MLFGRSRRLLNAALKVKAFALQIAGQFGLQGFQAFPRVDFIGVQSSIRRDRNMDKVHVRRFFIQMHHCGDEIFLPHKFRQKGFAFLEEASGVLR